jgi:hypothetical protein
MGLPPPAHRPARAPAVALSITLSLTLACASKHSSSPSPSPAASSSSHPGPSLPANQGVVTNAADALRTGWYPNEPALSPTRVGSGTFGVLFSTPVRGPIYAQPLVCNGTLLVASSSNDVYGLDPQTGAQRWARNLGGGTVGVTGTPAIDADTNTAYLFAKTTTNEHYAHALDVATGDERPGFPVRIQGAASNAPGAIFAEADEFQRAGVLLLGGVFYGAFGSHGDRGAYRGFVVGVSTGAELVTMWTTETDAPGAGIWQSGAGLVSDAPGSILLATGNGPAPQPPTRGQEPGGALGESVVRLAVQPDRSLRAIDFFAPHEANSVLNTVDGDLGSAGPMALPAQYGTDATPHLAVQFGKHHTAYLLNRDDLGGAGMGADGGDAVIQTIAVRAPVWGRPSAWPGEGPYVYVVPGGSPLEAYEYAADATGGPSLTRVAETLDDFGYDSSSPIVTSDGLTPGSALVWAVRTPVVRLVPEGGAPTPTEDSAELRAYAAVPSAGALRLVFAASLGMAARWSLPGVDDGIVYVGTADHVFAFGEKKTL